MQLRTSTNNNSQHNVAKDAFYRKTHSDKFMHNIGPWENFGKQPTSIQNHKFSTQNLREKQYISEESKRFLINTRHCKNNDHLSLHKLQSENIGSYDFKNTGENDLQGKKDKSRFLRLKTVQINQHLCGELGQKAESLIGFTLGAMRASHTTKMSSTGRTAHKCTGKTTKMGKVGKAMKTIISVQAGCKNHTGPTGQTDYPVQTGRSRAKPNSQRDRLNIGCLNPGDYLDTKKRTLTQYSNRESNRAKVYQEKNDQTERASRRSDRTKSEIKSECDRLPIFYLKPPKNTVMTREKNLMKIRNLKNKRLRIVTN